MKKNVLQYVQDTLSIMDSDLVDSLDDTLESEQVAELLKQCYYDLINRQEWNFLYQPLVLTSAGDPDSPTKFRIPDEVKFVDWLGYNVSEDSDIENKGMCYLDPETFLDRHRISGEDRKLITVGRTVQFYITTNKQPYYWTSFDDEYVYFDSFDSSLDTTMVTSKLRGYGIVNPEFQVTDMFVPDIPSHMVQLLQHELNAAAMFYFKQQQSSWDQSEIRRQEAHARRNQSKVERNSYYAFTNGRAGGRNQHPGNGLGQHR